MGLRESIGNWLLGGALEKAELNAILWKNDFDRASMSYDEIFKERQALKSALEEIAALETKHANATVRKMARIAREATK